MGIILIDPAWAGFYLRRTAKCYYLQEESLKRELFLGAFWKCSTLKGGKGCRFRKMDGDVGNGTWTGYFYMIIYHPERVFWLLKGGHKSQVRMPQRRSNLSCLIVQLYVKSLIPQNVCQSVKWARNIKRNETVSFQVLEILDEDCYGIKEKKRSCLTLVGLVFQYLLQL